MYSKNKKTAKTNKRLPIISILILMLMLSLIACDEATPDLLNEYGDEKSANTDNENGDGDNTIQTAITIEPTIFPYQFTAVDVYGNNVAQDDLGEKEMFFVYQWATWCGPCVNGMPKLAKIAEQFGERVGFIALIDDYEQNLEGAVNIIESSEVPEAFLMVNANGNGVKSLLELVETGFFPSSVIIYGGELIGPEAGANYNLIEGLLNES
ncbi:MAG: thioredoxin family protein [Oscillospiraceae bacterium]|nr:thioredoxin family protein [Oscillospiraceae bacterium]